MSKYGAQPLLVFSSELAEAYYLHLRKAREILHASANSGQESSAPAAQALNRASLSLMEAHFGYSQQAQDDANNAIKLAPKNFLVRAAVAPALARAGDVKRSAKMADELNQSYPLDTQMQCYWLPAIQAAVALSQKNADKAVDLLRVTIPYDLSTTGPMEPVYVRGETYLALNNSRAAAAEFQNIIEHPGVTLFDWGTCAPRAGTRKRAARQQGRIAGCVSGFSDPVERRRPRHPHLETSQGRVRKASIAPSLELIQLTECPIPRRRRCRY